MTANVRKQEMMCDYVNDSRLTGGIGATPDTYAGMASQQAANTLGGIPRRYSPLEEMEKQQAGNDEQNRLLWEGMNFLRENPAFNDFIALIRKGAIRI